MKQSLLTSITVARNNRLELLIIIGIFLLFLFLRTYQFELRHAFGWDQVDNAWAAKNILVNHEMPLKGMQAKGNSGIYIGSLYYYYVAFFYYLTNLDPVASVLVSLVTSCFTFFVIYFIFRSIGNRYIALIGLFLHTVSIANITAERVQWPVNFIFPFSLLIFYSLYNIVHNKVRYILLLSTVMALMFHIHFTAIYFPIIVLLVLPLFPRTKQTLLYMLYSIPIIGVLIMPIFILFTIDKAVTSSSQSYFSSYFHGLHLRRFLQLFKDAFIQNESLVYFKWLKHVSMVTFIVFPFLYIRDKKNNKPFLLLYLCTIWFLIPWLIFTVYSGEISDYYFMSTRPIVLLIYSYIIFRIITLHNKVVFFILSIALCYYAYANIGEYTQKRDYGLFDIRKDVQHAIDNGRIIQFS